MSVQPNTNVLGCKYNTKHLLSAIIIIVLYAIDVANVQNVLYKFMKRTRSFTFFSILFLANVTEHKLFNLSVTNSFVLNYKVCSTFPLCNLYLVTCFFRWFMKSYTAVWLVGCSLLESWSAHDIVLELLVMYHYIILHVLLQVLLLSLLFFEKNGFLNVLYS